MASTSETPALATAPVAQQPISTAVGASPSNIAAETSGEQPVVGTPNGDPAPAVNASVNTTANGDANQSEQPVVPAASHYLGLPPSLSPTPKTIFKDEPPASSEPASSMLAVPSTTAETQPPLGDNTTSSPQLPMETLKPEPSLLPPTAATTIPEHVEQPVSQVRDEPEPTLLTQAYQNTGIGQNTGEESAVAVAGAANTEKASEFPYTATATSEIPAGSSLGVSTTLSTMPPTVSAGQPQIAPPPASDVTMQDAPDLNATVAATPAETSIAVPTGDVAADDNAMDIDSSNNESTSTNGVVRPREEDDSEAPSAKRAKVESEPTLDITPSFKVPELPTLGISDAPAASLPTAPNENTGAATLPALAVSATAAAVPGPAIDPDRTFDSNPITKDQKRYLIEQFRKAKKIKYAASFVKPVDPVGLGIPNYPNVVKNPMDLSTIESKLRDDKYSSVDDMVSDVRLMVNNSVLFNGLQHDVSQAAINLRGYIYKTLETLPTKDDAASAVPTTIKKEQVSRPANPRRESRVLPAVSAVQTPPAASPQTFSPRDGIPQIRRNSSINDGRPKREIHKPPPRDLPYSATRPQKKRNIIELRFCDHVLKEMFKAQHASFMHVFYDPVDPVALGIPNYFQVIKKPMDMYTITMNLKNKHYATAKEFKHDMEQMFNNCFKFNLEGDNVWKMGKEAEQLFNTVWEEKADWIRKNQPPSEPSDASDDEEEDDDEDEEEETKSTDLGQIAALQAQVAAIQDKIAEIAAKKTEKQAESSKGKKAKKESKASQSAKVKRTNSLAVPTKSSAPKVQKKPKIPIVTQLQKREVSDAILGLDNAGMQRAVQIIRNGVPALQGVNDDELELDIDEIPNEVVWELYQFVVGPKSRKANKKEPEPLDYEPADDDYEPPARQRTSTGAAPGGRKKNKPMTATEQERKIKELENKVQGFDNGVPVASAVGAASSDGTPAGNGDSDDDDEDSESEEE